MMAVNFGTYMDLGWKLIPISPKTKIPCIKPGTGFTAASCDYEQLLDWIDQFPDCNWGLVCANSGLVAVDVDAKGLSAWDQLVKLHGEPKTLTQQSGSGVGRHYVFTAARDARYTGAIVPGIDVKHKGYILVEPSIHKSGKPYQWINWVAPQPMPEWLHQLTVVGKKYVAPAKAPDPCKEGDERFDAMRRIVEGLRDKELNYADWVAAGQAIHAETGGSDEGRDLFLYLTDGKAYSEGDEDKALYKWNSFLKDGGRGFGTLKRIAVDKGLDVSDAVLDFSEKWMKSDGRYIALDREQATSLINQFGLAMIAEQGSIATVDTECFPPLVKWRTREQAQNILGPYCVRSIEKDGAVKLIPALNVWLENAERRTFDKVVFDPHDKCARNINLWKGIPRGGMKGDVDDILFLVKSLCANNRPVMEYLLDWCAQLIQHPEIKTAVTPVFIAKQGAGKNFFAQEIMGRVVGEGNFLLMQSTDELLQQFNGDHARKFLTVLDEASWGGNGKLVAKMKAFTGSSTRRIEEKYAPKYEIKDFSRFMILSNSMDAVKIESGNRRYLVLDSYCMPLPDKALFRRLGERLRKGDELYLAWLYFLENRDISNFDPYTFPSHLDIMGTEAKLMAMTPVGRYWYQRLFDDISTIVDEQGRMFTNVVWQDFQQWCSLEGERFPASTNAFWNDTKDSFGHEWPLSEARRGMGARFHCVDIGSMRKTFLRVNRLPAPEGSITEEDF